MNKKLIRLTEGDLHRIVRESVNRILRESDEENYELVKQQLRDARAKKDKAEILRLGQEYQRLKEKLGKTKTLVNPDVRWSDEENIKRGHDPYNGNTKWKVGGLINRRREMDKDDREGIKGVRTNDIDSILGV